MMMEKQVKIILLLVIFSALFAGLVWVVHIIPQSTISETSNPSSEMIDQIKPVENISFPTLGSMKGIVIQTAVPNAPESLPLYKGVLHQGDTLDVILGDSFSEKTNLISEQKSPHAVRDALGPYGGLPSDAELGVSRINYAIGYNPTTLKAVESYPLCTVVSYHRKINGMPVGGQSDKIRVELGENGTLLRIYKIWRTLEYTGHNVSIITPTKAIEKLQNGEFIEQPIDSETILINNISLGYYEKNRTDPEIFLEPIWVFSGNTSSGAPIDLYVYARQFANFTATPTSGKIPLNVTFTDTSDGSPTTWYWDFGDGTNSTIQNPVHVYTSAGTYNVSMTAWNDLGRDTKEIPAMVIARKPAPPVAGFAATPVTGYAPLNVTFTDTSANNPVQWLWDFGDNTNASIQNPIHTYRTPGNFTVSLGVTNDDGMNVTVMPAYISVTNPPPTTMTISPTITVTKTITTKPTTSIPTSKPTPTHAPLSPLIAIISIASVWILAGLRRTDSKK